MEKVIFKPYVGKEYHNGYEGKKILILGESHNCGEIKPKCGIESECQQLDECEFFIKEFLERFFKYHKGILKYEKWMITFKRFTNIFLGKKSSPEELINFWDSVMFYNYVQNAMRRSRIAPKNDYYENSKEAFFEVLKEYKPDLIIIWGKRLEGKLPNENKTDADIQTSNIPGKIFYYETEGKKIPAYAIYHPSSPAFSYKSHAHLRCFLQICEKQRFQ